MVYITAYTYKPNRILYYMEPTENEIDDYLKGVIPDSLKVYDGAFGTYCSPSLFIIGDEEPKRKVIGIEYRPDDLRIEYPTDLNMVNMEASYMVSAVLPEDVFLSADNYIEQIEAIKYNVKDREYYRGLIRINENADFVIIDTTKSSGMLYYKAEDVSAEDFFDDPVLDTATESQLYNAAFRDSITGHYNWNYIWPIITGYGLRGIQDYAFVHFDVKDFKAINFVYGHDVANNVLRRVTQKMMQEPWIYHSARCDNDNFSMMIKDMPVEETVEKLLKFFDDISVLDEDKNYHVYYRCGFVPMKNTLLLCDRVADAGKHIQRLGNKLYETEIQVYTDKMHDELDWSEKIKAYLDTAIENDEFLVYLQPKYDIRTNKLCGAEALIRWKYQGKALLSPARFVPIFETGGLISKLDYIVLNKVCAYLKRWKNEGKTLYPISVNLSRKSIGDVDLIRHITEIVDLYCVDHSLIEFELTESVAYENQDYMIEVLNELKKNGFKISIDDFGTGYSSLSILTVLPINTIKIDKSFVDRIGNTAGNDKDKIVAKQIIDLAHNLELECIAEGAEDESQVNTLLEFGCEMVQGYYFSKPLPVEEFEDKAFK